MFWIGVSFYNILAILLILTQDIKMSLGKSVYPFLVLGHFVLIMLVI